MNRMTYQECEAATHRNSDGKINSLVEGCEDVREDEDVLSALKLPILIDAGGKGRVDL